MLRLVMLLLASLGLTFYACLSIEFHSLPSLQTTLGYLIDAPNYVSLLIFYSILFLIPIISILYVLASFKKFVFNHVKNISFSYTRAIWFLLISYSLLTILNMLSFLFDLAFKEEFYLIVRLSYMLPDTHFPHMFAVNLLIGLLVQSSMFTVIFLITEILLTYKFKVTTMSFSLFLTKNYKVIGAIVTIFLCNIMFILKMENLFFNFSKINYMRNFGLADKVIESTLLSIILMYLYTIITIYES